ncbi:MAG: apolipoprotein N-acyltransferase [Alphaproteobacteria bacterium]|nr:apolipoprotein N-acyltransferase [Alphaproteobacteria bacterium]
MNRLPAHLAALGGWRLWATGAGLGSLATLALPPWNLLPLLLPAVSGLLWLTAGRGPRAAAFAGWSFGCGFFAAGLYWVGEAMLVDAARHAWLIPFAITGLAGGLALFPAAVMACLSALEASGAVKGAAARLLAFAALWALVEWLRGWVFTGFPWQLLAYAWSDVAAMRQVASLVGAFGLSLLTVAIAGAPVLWMANRVARRIAAGLVAMLALAWGWGELRIDAAPEAVGGARLRLVQGNIDQRLKWLPDNRLEVLRSYLRLSSAPSADGVAPIAILWPETAVPFALAEDEAGRQAVMRELPAGASLITGIQRFETLPGDERRFYNSIIAVALGGAIEAVYDKEHLVPFGEYMPLRGILPFDRLVPGIGDFTPGPGRVTWRLTGLPPASPLICYEAIFPGAAVNAADRPAWLLNVTNDGWFGLSAGPPQHLAIARMRAVEEGVPLIRVANTGISAAIDAYGRTIGAIPLGREGVLDVTLPPALDAPPLFARAGNALALGLALMTLAAAFALRCRAP